MSTNRPSLVNRYCRWWCVVLLAGIAVVIVVLAMAAVVTLMLIKRTDSDEIPPPTVAQVAMWLQYFPGAPGGPGALKLTLYNRTTREAAFTNAAGTLQADTEQVVQLHVDHTQWDSLITFTVQDDENSEPAPLSDGVSLVTAPGEDELQLGATESYVLTFKLTASAAPPPGAQIRAVFHHANQEMVSNAVPSPLSPSGEGANNLALQREARAAHVLGDYEQLLRLSEEMITTDPTAFGGYWFKGIALEAQGDAEGALQAYETALQYLPEPGRTQDLSGHHGHADPALDIFQRVRALRHKLSGQD